MKIIDIISINPYGFNNLRKPKLCKWCSKEIYWVKGIRQCDYCCKDCKDDYKDDSKIQSYKRQLRRQLRKNKKYLGRDEEKIKARHKLYYQVNKEKIKAQMQEIRARKQVIQKSYPQFIHLTLRVK